MRLFRYSDRRGVALPLALFTLVIAAVMITAVFYVGRLEQRMGYNSLAATEAFEAAETGLTTVMDNWSASSYNGLATGGTVALPSAPVGSNAVYSASVRRLNQRQFLIQAEGRYLINGQATTRRNLARLVRLDAPAFAPAAPLVTRMGIEVDGSIVDGTDYVPTGWGPYCSAAGPMMPAIIDSAGTVTTIGACTGQSCLTGSPKIQTDPIAVNSGTFTQFGNVGYASLAAAADKVVTGPIGGLGPSFDPGPSCRTGDLTNWGSPDDPGGPCGNYFPIIHAPGNLTLAGGVGQGLLLVDGDLTVGGGVDFTGIVVVRGTVQLIGGQVTGTLLVMAEVGGTSHGSGTGLDYSRCAVERAATAAGQPTQLQERSWVQLY
jgi:hypothetical protein